MLLTSASVTEMGNVYIKLHYMHASLFMESNEVALYRSFASAVGIYIYKYTHTHLKHYLLTFVYINM